KIVGNLEAHLMRLSDPSLGPAMNPHAVEHVALRLAAYYRQSGNAAGLTRVLTIYRDAFLVAAEPAAPLIAHSWLKKVFETLHQYGLSSEVSVVEERLRKCGEESVRDMKAIPLKMSVSKEELDEFLKAMTEGSFDSCVERVATHFIPNPDEAERFVLDMARKAPLQALIPQILVDDKGRPVAAVGSVEDDLASRVVLQISQNMALSAPFLEITLKTLRERGRLTARTVLAALGQSPLFAQERMPLLELGLDAYCNGNHAVAAHLLVPQIEAALRDLLVMAGGQAYRPGHNGELRLKTLDSVLRDPAIEAALPADVRTYLRILLTDARGWNVRNDVAHGLLHAGQYTWTLTDRVVHALMVLSLVRKQEAKPDKDE
ncbi:MAG: DUF4209 domain-containing protein, partial [Bacillota bacterium]